MTETEQTAGSNSSLGKPAVRAWTQYRATGVLSETRSRFEGEGVRYKAKLIGMDPVPQAQGEKMCLDSMMKLKGFEVAERKMGKHKMKIWLKISSNGLKILDERTGVCLHDQDRTRISSVTKDKSDPRALAYIYKHEEAYILFYIKTATQADPILSDIMEVCQRVDQETSHKPAETPDISLVVLNEGVASQEMGEANEKVLNPPPDSSSGQTTQTSTSNELMQIFSPPMTEPLSPDQIPSVSQPTSPAESPQQGLSTAQILSMFPRQPPGGSPYISPPLSPNPMPWGQQGLLGNQTGFWPSVPGMPAGGPQGVMVPPALVQPQPGFMMMMSPTAPQPLNEYPNPLNSITMPNGMTGAPGAPAMDDNPLLG